MSTEVEAVLPTLRTATTRATNQQRFGGGSHSAASRSTFPWRFTRGPGQSEVQQVGIVSNLSTQGRKLYHLGVGTTVSRSSLARVNAEQPYTLYETLFGRLLSRCRQCAPRHGFRFKNKLYAVDATTIDLCLAVFPWASFRRTKAAIKLHVGLDQAGHLPSFVSVTEGKTGDVKVARTWTFPAGSVVVADRAYLDFKWFHQLQARGVTFVTRLKRGVRYRVTREHDVGPSTAGGAPQGAAAGAASKSMRSSGSMPMRAAFAANRRAVLLSFAISPADRRPDPDPEGALAQPGLHRGPLPGLDMLAAHAARGRASFSPI